MGIDGVGKPPGAGPSAPLASQVSRAGPEFVVEAASDVAAPQGAAASSALGQLQRGEIGLDEYLEVQLEEATSHLGSLPPEQLDFIRETLREELRSDPALVELVRRATGIAPTDLER
jgi:hypothetical protein